MLYIILLMFYPTKSISNCNDYDFQDCTTDLTCYWDIWSRNTCYNVCDILDENTCGIPLNCKWDKTMCVEKACEDQQEETECNNLAACEFKNSKCWDQSCLVLQVQEEIVCPRNYCIWNQSRMICYDKKCGDYSNIYLCNEISFCEWKQYKCIRNLNQQIQY